MNNVPRTTAADAARPTTGNGDVASKPGRGSTLRRTGLLFAALSLLSLLLGCAGAPRTASTVADDDFGVLVMAHGGGPVWDREVAAALAPIDADHPLEIAFGMADADSLQDAVRRLEQRGVSRIGVVRLFISGESWRERTEQILGLRAGAPPKPAAPAPGPDHHQQHGGSHAMPGHRMAFWRVDSAARFALSTQGLADAPEMDTVLIARARALSRTPAREDVLILAHGPGDDGENQRWLQRIDRRADALQRAMPFHRVRVETLREDWPDQRKAAEARIRRFITETGEQGRRALVIPYRVQGFGPYAQVLAGLDYVADGQGLVPSVEVEHWVRRQARELQTSGFATRAVP